MGYVYSLPTEMAFDTKGIFGYSFGPLNQKRLEIYYILSNKGHDTFMISKKITRTYYILSGNGNFTIEGHVYNVSVGMLVEVPPKVEYSYSGRMTLLAISNPRWFAGNDTHTRWNPDVVSGRLSAAPNSRSRLNRLISSRVLGKSPLNAYLRLNRYIWRKLPAQITELGFVRWYGTLLHRLVRMQNVRGQLLHTFFLRNRATLELIARVVARRRTTADVLKVAVLGCSAGAEAYSVAWKIRSTCPNMKLALRAVDISRRAVDLARGGVYSQATAQITGTDPFDRMTEAEIDELFDRRDDGLAIKPWLREGIKWDVCDVSKPEIVDLLGPQEIVVANNFLCHMDAPAAEACLRNIASLVGPNGYLFVSGIDIEVRTRVANDLGWLPLTELIEEIHQGDPRMATDWPWNYSALEPLNKRRRDWQLRYAAAFQLSAPSGGRAAEPREPAAVLGAAPLRALS